MMIAAASKARDSERTHAIRAGSGRLRLSLPDRL